MKIAVSGASGFLGRALTKYLSNQGHEIVPLVRDRKKADQGGIYWSPSDGLLDSQTLEGKGAIIHLAGENVAAGRWSRQQKDRILKSRVDSTRLLASAITSLSSPPEAFICASAIGFYGNRGDEVLTEDSHSGDDFLSQVSREWEAECRPVQDKGIRTVILRTGVVMSPEGGALAGMLPTFRKGLGGKLGSGRQWFSWISLEDEIRAIGFLLNSELGGPFNLTSPNPVTNGELTKSLARNLKRPAFFSVPGFVLKIMMGEMAQALLLTSQRVHPDRLLQAGFQFRHTRLEETLKQFLN